MSTRSMGLRKGVQGLALLTALWLAGCGGSDEGVGEQSADAKSAIEAEADADAATTTGPQMQALAVQSPGPSAPYITVAHFPVNHQLYPRASIGDSTATVSFAASNSSATASALTLTIDGVATAASPVSIDPGATVTMTATVPAALRASVIKLTASTSNGNAVVAEASDVVGGDVYVVTGQSNAQSTIHPKQNAAVARDAASRWIRTVGGMWETTPASEANHGWYVAQGGGLLDSSSTVGKWPLRMARDMVDKQKVPIAILNGARGSEPVAYFLPAFVQTGDEGNNYKRMMSRLNAYNLAPSVRAVLYYQGEADTLTEADATAWSGKFNELLTAWDGLFPNLTQVYLTQIRGCVGSPFTSSVREQQRLLANTTAYKFKIQVMSTTAMGGFDGGCHFFYEGYRQLGTWYANLVMHDLYGASGAATAAPAPTNVWNSPDGTKLYISLANQNDSISVDAASKADFVITSSSGKTYQPTKVTASKGSTTWTLTLSLPAGATATSVSYRGEKDKGTAWITNSNGVGLLAFEAMPVSH